MSTKQKKSKNKKWDVTLFETNKYKIIIGLTVLDARPHLIMLFNGKNHRNFKMNVYDILADNDMFNDLVHAINKSFRRFKGSIFSIHLGHYQSRESPHFHAHLMLPIELYMKIVNRYLNPHTNLEYWDYLGEWSNRISHEGVEYKKNDLRNIQPLTKTTFIAPLSIIPPTDISTNTLGAEYTIVFHTTQPRIRFILKNDQTGGQILSRDELKLLLKIMLSYVKSYNLNDRSRGGCHLCIQNNFYVDSEFKDIKGYIQVDPINYYKMNPDREEWLKSYKNSSYYVVT
jgi:hypothetical protein